MKQPKSQSNLTKKISDLEQRIAAIEARNRRVEMDKKWETSHTRIAIIAIVTYVSLGLYMHAIDTENAWKAAVIPTFGFIFSTLVFVRIKRIWIQKNA